MKDMNKEFSGALKTSTEPELSLDGGTTSKVNPDTDDKKTCANHTWEINRDLASKHGVKPLTIRSITDKYRQAHPEWFSKGGKTSTGWVYQAYAPELVTLIENELDKRKAPPKGWKTSKEAARLFRISHPVINELIDGERGSLPDYFAKFYNQKLHQELEYLHPKIISLIEERLIELEKPVPLNWEGIDELSRRCGVNKLVAKTVIYRIKSKHADLFIDRLDTQRKEILIYCSPEVIPLAQEYISEKRLGRERPPEGWKTSASISRSTGTAQNAIDGMSDSYRKRHSQDFDIFVDPQGKLLQYHSPNLSSAIEEKLNKRESAPAGWVTREDIIEELDREMGTSLDKKSLNIIIEPYRKEHPEWFKMYLHQLSGRKSFKEVEHVSPQLAQIARDKIRSRRPAPEGWETRGRLAKVLDKHPTTIDTALDKYREKNPAWFQMYLTKGEHPKEAEHISPELIVLIKQQFGKLERAPEGWESNKSLAVVCRVADVTLARTARELSADPTEEIKFYLNSFGRSGEYYHPKLVEKLKLHFQEHVMRMRKEDEILALKADLVDFLRKVIDESSDEAKQFLSLLRVFGAARCIDILFSLHPKFRELPLDAVRGALSEYLGDTLLTSGAGSISGLAALEALPKTDQSTEEKFKNALVETVKDDCYKYYVTKKRGGSVESAHDILTSYLNNLELELSKGTSLPPVARAVGTEREQSKTLINHPLIGDAILEVLTYFQDIWAVEFSDRIATSLKDGREFPDLAQRINIKEIQDKKRMLIADEMGMGKSASAILAHEAAREKARKEGRALQPALILVPSNVAETWKRYLSSDGKRGGCFKEGEAPSVLEIESPADFAKVEGVDYVLMTQERLTERNQAVLETQWSTVIVDEVHKLKATDGVRSSLLRKIAQRQKPEDQLVLLSGTPIPNTVRDIAVTLTLLYPEKFKDTEPGELASQLLRGNLHQIRELLVPRMQAKNLAESVELPPLEEKVTALGLSPESTLQYRTFVEENDEMDQLSKLHFLRRWLLDPSLVDQEPDQTERIKGEKARALEKCLQTALEEGDTHIVVFVNDVVDGILRPSSKSPGSLALVDRLSLPQDVKRGIIHGDTSGGERTNLQNTFQSREGRMILFVSGNTADVGVDFSAGQRVISFNEPWTRYAHEQQRSRVYRPGVQNPVTSELLVTLNTIEQGIHEYVERKYHAIEKVLQGIPLSEIEKELLEKDAATDGADASFASEIAEQYLSAWDRLMRLFSASGEVGEEDFQRFVERHGKEYAELYKEFRARSFAGNVNRVCGTVIKSFARTLDRGQVPQVLDVASGPEMLRRALPEDLAKGVTSMDINPHMFAGKTEGPTIVAGWTQIPTPDQSFDVVSSSLAWVHSSMQPRKGEVDRVKVLEEMQRVLKVGGWAVIALTPARPLKDMVQFRAAVSELGFDIVEEYTGSIRTHDNAFQLPLLTLKKRENVEPKEDLVAWTKEVLERYPDAFAFEKSKSRGRHPRKMFGSCVVEAALNGTPTSLPMEVAFKDEDRKIYEEERGLLQVARSLKSVFAEMRAIPPHVLKQHNLSRVRIDNGSYALYTPFKTTESGLLIGETVWKGL